MRPLVSLSDVVVAMEGVDDSMRAFLNKSTGELVTLTSEELAAAEEDPEDLEDAEFLREIPEWQQESIRKAREVLESDDYLALPSRYEIHEYSIMKDFCNSVPDEVERADLLNLIRGSGAFGRFKDYVGMD
jgi:hypothetical protein